MKLTLEGLRERSAWEQAGIALPAFDAAALAAHTRQNPGWVHFGIGNIFRIFLGGIAQQLISRGSLSYGITCVESFDFEVVDKIYRPFDNLALAVTLRSDGSRRQEVLGSLCEAVAARGDEASRARLKEIFTAPGLQMVTFTITEKGYALKDPAGAYLPYIRKDLDGGPAQARTAMGLVCALMWERFQAGARPLALVSCDNVSQNGRKLRESVLEVARVWQERGAVSADFVSYLSDERQVSFPWTMIDKITPRPAEQVGKDLRALGVEDMEVVVTPISLPS